MRRLAGLLAAAATAVLLGGLAVAGCDTGGDGGLQAIRGDDLQGLDETTTSTTTTTTTPPTSTTAGPTTGPTSTTIVSEAVELHFVDGNQLQPVRVELASPVSPTRVIARLLQGPPEGDLGVGLRTLLPPGLVNFPVVDSGAGYVTVDLAAEAFALIDPADQRIAVGQIVMTLVNRPGIGQVVFTLDGEPLRVPRRDGVQSAPGEPVSKNDYVTLLGTAEAVTTTVPETLPSPSSEPASTPPP
jgi:spore germination protein GerM